MTTVGADKMITFADDNLEIKEASSHPVKVMIDFLEYNFYASPQGMQFTFKSMAQTVPPVPLAEEIFFDILVRIAGVFMKRRYENWMDPYTGEVLK